MPYMYFKYLIFITFLEIKCSYNPFTQQDYFKLIFQCCSDTNDIKLRFWDVEIIEKKFDVVNL